MKTLADLKRALAPGTTLTVVNHVHPELSGRRTVVAAQTKRIKLTLPDTHPRHADTDGSWLDLPVTITRPDGNDGGPFVTLTFDA